MQREVPLPVRVDEELDDALSWPVVCNGTCTPVENDVAVSDGEQVLARVADLLSTAVLDQSNWEEFCVCVCACKRK